MVNEGLGMVDGHSFVTVVNAVFRKDDFSANAANMWSATAATGILKTPSQCSACLSPLIWKGPVASRKQKPNPCSKTWIINYLDILHTTYTYLNPSKMSSSTIKWVHLSTNFAQNVCSYLWGLISAQERCISRHESATFVHHDPVTWWYSVILSPCSWSLLCGMIVHASTNKHNSQWYKSDYDDYGDLRYTR